MNKQPSPVLFFDTINAYQKTAALKAAIDLDLFTNIGETPVTAADLAVRCKASARGVRILCDYLTMLGFLTKQGDLYSLTLDSATFLNRKSPACIAGSTEFLSAKMLTSAFDDLAPAVRQGGTTVSEMGTIAPDHPVWVKFARGMAGLSVLPAQGTADLVEVDTSRPVKVLDVSASHGMFGILFAKKYPNAQIVALDWPNVLQVSRENAEKAGIASRFSTIAGSAFEVDLGTDYDVVLVPNFLHHFNGTDCTNFLKRLHAALRPGGQVAIVEFVPEPDRVNPPGAAGFSLIMLGTTPEGDAYTFAEYQTMLQNSGFKKPKIHPLLMQSVIIASK